MAVGDAYVFPGFLSPVLTQLFFPKPPTTFPTCFCRGERRKYAGKKSRLNRGSNSQPPYIFRYLIRITNDLHQCYSIIWRRLVSGVRKMKWGSGVKMWSRLNTARQRCFILQISFLMSCNGILTHTACKITDVVDIMALSHLTT